MKKTAEFVLLGLRHILRDGLLGRDRDSQKRAAHLERLRRQFDPFAALVPAALAAGDVALALQAPDHTRHGLVRQVHVRLDVQWLISSLSRFFSRNFRISA